VSDPRRAQGKRYDLVHALLYCVLAVASGATSYRKIHLFIVSGRPAASFTAALPSEQCPHR
jgi:hypothetical protein